jgi:AcrR family transcriptional regulator
MAGGFLMASDSEQETAKRAPLTRRAVIEGALVLADAEGLAAITIRRLARELGVTPMAIYWHVRNKDELLDGVAARVFDEVTPATCVSGTWQEQLRALLVSLITVLRAHPAAASLLTTRTVSSESGLRATEALLDILDRGGFSPSEATQIARHALRTLANLASDEPGVVAREESTDRRDARQRARHALEALPSDRYPRLVEAAGPLSEGVDPDAYVAFGLDLLLAGIEAMAIRNHRVRNA